MVASDQKSLRITVTEELDSVIVKLEGTLAGRVVNELKRTGVSLSQKLAGRKAIVDLREVAFVDAAGLAVLREFCQLTAATIEADSPLTRYFAEKATTNSPAGLLKGAA